MSKLLELFAGSRSVGNVAESLGFEVFSCDWQPFEKINFVGDIETLTKEEVPFIPDVIWASPDCFTAGHLVKTSNGYCPIDDLQIGDRVLTNENRYMPIYATMSKKTDFIYNVKISGCKIIEVTEEHPFLARKKNKVWNNIKRSYDLVLGEPQWVKAKYLDNTYRVQKLINQNSRIPDWLGVFHSVANQTGLKKKKRVNELKHLMCNESFWWIIGRYLGDGWHRVDESKNRFDFNICCSKNEDNEIKSRLDLLPFNYHYSKKHTTNVFTISKKELAVFVSQLGKGSRDKFIPDFILDLPVVLLKQFIEGYVSADGCIYKDKLNKKQVTVTTISEKLAYSFQLALLKAYGTHSSITYNDLPNNLIQGRAVNSKPSYIISYYLDGSKREYTTEDNCVWVNVSSINRFKKDTEVFNISVVGDETYTVNNVTVHNCSTYSIAAISHHRDNGTPKSEYAIKCDSVNQHFMDLIKYYLTINQKLKYFIENPRGYFRKMDFVNNFLDETNGIRNTVWYCQYGDDRAKPTDIFTNCREWLPRPMCKNGNPNCHHERAPRGSKTGTQGRSGSYERSKIPSELCYEILNSISYESKIIKES